MEIVLLTMCSISPLCRVDVHSRGLPVLQPANSSPPAGIIPQIDFLFSQIIMWEGISGDEHDHGCWC